MPIVYIGQPVSLSHYGRAKAIDCWMRKEKVFHMEAGRLCMRLCIAWE